MKVINKLDHHLTKGIDVLLSLTFTVMLTLAALQVFLRFFFDTGLVWGDVAARHIVLWVGFLGAYLATRDGKHFHIDALTRTFSDRARRWFGRVTDLFAAAVCFFLVQASYTFVTIAIDPDGILFLGIPEKVVAWIVPIGFGLMSAQFLLRIYKSFWKEAPCSS